MISDGAWLRCLEEWGGIAEQNKDHGEVAVSLAWLHLLLGLEVFGN